MANPNIPIFGVCMGHQLLASVHDITVSYASQPMHGRISAVRVAGLDGDNKKNRESYHPAARMLFHSIIGMSSSSNNTFDVTRYHSLSVQMNDKNVRDSSTIVPLAYSVAQNSKVDDDTCGVEKDELMALAVLDKPWVGVQFHPESVGTKCGKQILQNWCHFVSWFTTNSTATTTALRSSLQHRTLAKSFQWEQVPSDLRLSSITAADRKRKVFNQTPNFEQNIMESSSRISVSQNTQVQYEDKCNGQKLFSPRLLNNNSIGSPLLLDQNLRQNFNNESCRVDQPHQFKYQILIHKIENVLETNASWLQQGANGLDRLGSSNLSQHAIRTNSEEIFDALYSNMTCAFWLDSSNSGSSILPTTLPTRLSIMGAMDGPYSHLVEYFGAEESAERCESTNNIDKEVRVHYPRDISKINLPGNENASTPPYIFKTDILSYLQHVLYPNDGPLVAHDDVHIVSPILVEKTKATATAIANYSTLPPSSTRESDLPFDYRGGYVGFLGYEVRHDTLRLLSNSVTPLSSSPPISGGSATIHDYALKDASATIPDAAFIFSDRSVVCDHLTGDVYLVGYALSPRIAEICSPTSAPNLAAVNESIASVIDWMRSVYGTIRGLQQAYSSSSFYGRNIFDPLHSSSDNRVKTSPHKNTMIKTKNGFANQESERTIISVDAFVPRRSKELYTENISKCHEYIRLGESYELCLTNQMELDTSKIRTARNALQASSGNVINNGSCNEKTSLVGKLIQKTRLTNTKDPLFLESHDYFAVDPYIVYKELRKSNPAPFAAFLRFDPLGKMPIGGKTRAKSLSPYSGNLATKISLAVCSSSPERFLSLTANGTLESKPIKGTCPRGIGNKHDEELATALQRSEKNIAENLMIVDLIRNDFGRVCKVGSISVPRFGALESFSSVHQLVSTIQGELKNGYSAIDALIAAFPGGSMTGAPKKRTMELLHDLEERKPRGPYSGCIGYISPNNAMDMNIVIRTAVLSPCPALNSSGLKINVGAGGAITALSDKDDEYEEMLLKTRAVIRAVTRVLNRVAREQLSTPKDNVATSS